MEGLDVRIQIPSENRALVEMRMQFRSASLVKYSTLFANVDRVTETISSCDGRVLNERAVPLAQRLFPALHTQLPADCASVKLAYEVQPAAKIPLLVPDVKLGAGALVNIEVQTAVQHRGTGFPRLAWSPDGVGRRRMRHVPAYVDVPIGTAPVLASTEALNVVVAGAIMAALLAWRRWRTRP